MAHLIYFRGEELAADPIGADELGGDHYAFFIVNGPAALARLCERRGARVPAGALYRVSTDTPPAVVERLVAAGADPNHLAGVTLLRDAASAGRVELLRTLIKLGATPHAGALCDAVQHDQIDAARILFDAGAPPLQMLPGLAVSTGNTELAQLVFERGCSPKGEPSSILAEAAAVNNVAMLELLAAHGAEVTGTNAAVALHAASGNGHVEATTWLLDHGARAGADAYSIVRNNYVEIARLLLKRGAIDADHLLFRTASSDNATIARLALPHASAKWRANTRREAENHKSLAVLRLLDEASGAVPAPADADGFVVVARDDEAKHASSDEPVQINHADAEPAKAAAEPVKSAAEPAKAAAEPVKSAAEPAKAAAEPAKAAAEPAGGDAIEPAKAAAEPAKAAAEPAGGDAIEPAKADAEPVKSDAETAKSESAEPRDAEAEARAMLERMCAAFAAGGMDAVKALLA